ncbi:MAG: hypothetical protein AMQ22_01677 [Candidatus Methanofastidiosum methylothiophilum]|uniref:Uncharacterized protein n=1 Tax=Candidatus Methanofastidiosum methylothiophilum TaxID=1705564 RepID=A0A150IWL2_9EURY|nr:MAG: hypothetical protein AMQ22_01677 [Candidatus Methanofastidiosum methylthiophilus]
MRKISKNRAMSILVISLLLVSAFPVILAEAQERPEKLTDDVLYSRYMTFHQKSEVAIIAMDAIIDFYKENGIDTSELTGLKVKLEEFDGQAKIAAQEIKREEFYRIVEESRETIKSFRDIAKDKDVEGQSEAVKSAIQENKDYLTGLRDETSGVKKGIYLKAIDNRLEKLEQISNRLEEKGVDVAEINSKIDEISNNRAQISEESDREALKEFHQGAKKDAKEIRELIKEAIEEIKETQ